MFKVIFTFVITIFFLACSVQTQRMSHNHAQMPPIFQSVSVQKAILLQTGEERASCPICGMNLVRFYKTSHASTVQNKAFHYCSLHCMAEHLDAPNELINPQVVDVTSLKMIPVAEAHYVVGSSVRGTMSRVSKYAFKSLEDAQEFQKKNGDA